MSLLQRAFNISVAYVVYVAYILGSYATLQSLTASAALSVLAMGYNSTSYAQTTITPEQAAHLGNVEGASYRGQIVAPSSDTTNPAAPTLTYNSNQPGASGTVSLDDLFGAGSNTTANANTLANGTATYGDRNAMNAQANVQNGQLMAPANNDNWAMAYKTLRDQAQNNNQNKVDNRGDPALANTQSIAQSASLSGLSSTCTTTVNNTTTATNVHMADYRTCVRFTGTPTCTINRVPSGSSSNSQVNLLNWRGQIPQGEIGMWIPIFETVSHYRDSSITGPYGSDVKAYYLSEFPNASLGFEDNYMMEVDSTSAVYPFPYNTPELDQWVAGQRIKARFQDGTGNAGPDGMAVDISPDPSYFEGRFYYASGNAPPMRVTSFLIKGGLHWGIYVHIENFAGPARSFDMNFYIGQGTTTFDDVDVPQGCSTETLCHADPDPGWVSSGSPLDLASTSTWKCNMAYNIGDVVLGIPLQTSPILFPGEAPGSAITGVPVCFSASARNWVCNVPPANGNSCNTVENNPACHKFSESCIPGNLDPQGNCSYTEERWDCGYDTQITQVNGSPTTVCAGPIRCMGNDCVEDTPREQNQDFQQAASQLSSANWAKDDFKCSTPTNCEIFKGEPYTCSQALGGLSDCCNIATGVSIKDYMTMIAGTKRLSDDVGMTEYLTNIGTDITNSGAWQELANPISETWNNMTEPITSAWESLSSRFTGDATTSLTQTALKEALQEMQNAMAEWVAETLGPTIAEGLFGAGATTGTANFATSSVGQALGTAMAVIGYVYLAYMALQMIYACSEKEMELSLKKDMRLCHSLGTYCGRTALGMCFYNVESFCCFKAPLARIIHEQIRLHPSAVSVPLTWEPPSQTPNCPGLTMDQFANLDWSQINLDEWVALLQDSNVIPSAANASTMLTQENLTKNHIPGASTNTNALNNATQTLGPANGGDAKAIVNGQLWFGLP